VASFAAKYPEMVDEKIILLCPAGLLKVGSDFRGAYSIDRQISIGCRCSYRPECSLEWSCWFLSLASACSSMRLLQRFEVDALIGNLVVALAKKNIKIYNQRQ